MHRYRQTQCETNLAAYTMDGENMREKTQYNSYSKRTNQRTERRPTLEQSAISDLRKQRLPVQDSLQE